MIRKLLLTLALLGGLCAPALAQVQNDLTGNETWNAGQGPGGPGAQITSGMVRGGTNVFLFNVTGNITIGIATGTSVLNEGGNLLVSPAPATANITMPPNPVTNGAIIGICNGTASAFVNTLTVVANTGQSLIGTAALPTLAASTCIYWQFRRTNTTWYRIT